MIKTFVLLVTIYYPPDPMQVFRYNFLSEERCQKKGEEIAESWAHITDFEASAEISYICKPSWELELS